MKDHSKKIPRYVNELLQIGPYEIDELAVLVLVLFIGISSGYIVTGIIGAFVVTHFFTYFKSKNSRGVILHMLYWYGIIAFKKLWCENAFARYWVK